MTRTYRSRPSLLLWAYALAPTNALTLHAMPCGCLVAAKARPEGCPAHEVEKES